MSIGIRIGRDMYGYYVMKGIASPSIFLRTDILDWESSSDAAKRKDKFKTVRFPTREEAEQQLKKWFESQPPEVFAEYIAERMNS